MANMRMRDLTNLTIEAEELDKSFGHNLQICAVSSPSHPHARRAAAAPPVHHILLGGPTQSTGGGPNTATSLELQNILGFFGFLIDS